MTPIRAARSSFVALLLLCLALAVPSFRAAASPAGAPRHAGADLSSAHPWSGASHAPSAWGSMRAAGLGTSRAERRTLPARPQAMASVAAAPGARASGVTSVPDGAGGTYVAWEDLRDGPSDIYLLRLTNTGAVASGWPASGVVVCNAPGAQSDVFMTPDGANGVIVAWQDFRNGWVGGDGRAQRVSTAGAVLWAANGVLVGTGFTEQPSVAPDGSGGMLIAWSSGSPGDIYALRVNAAGAVPAGWTASGAPVCAQVDDQLNPVICADGAGGAIVAWEDLRTVNGNVFAQHLNASAAAQWTADGIQMDGASFANDPAILPDGSGGALLCWWEENGTGLVRGQRINGSGTAQWGGGVDLSGTLFLEDGLFSVPDGLGGMIAVCNTYNMSGNGVVVTQRVNASGARQWGSTPAVVATLTPTQLTIDLEAVGDGSGGAYFAWVLDDFTLPNGELRAQRVTAAGAVPWAAGGVVVKTGLDESFTPSIAPDGSGGMVIGWPDWDDLFVVTIRAQRYNAAGAAQLGAGAEVFRDPGVQIGSLTVSDGGGGAWLAWTQRTANGQDIRARHVTSGGVSSAPTIAITNTAGDQLLVGAVSDGAGGMIVGWNDRSGSGGADVRAQRLNASGVPQWGASGLAVCTAVQAQWLTSMASDGLGGALFAWYDWRNLAADSNLDIYAQRVNAAGAAQWGANGLGVCNDPGFQDAPHVVSDGAGGGIIAWEDYRAASSAYGQRVNAAGATQWAADGIALFPLDSGTAYGTLAGAVGDGAGGVILLEAMYSFDPVFDVIVGTEFDAYRFNGTGTGMWGGAAVAYQQATYSEFPRMVADGTGGALVAWSDGRGATFDIYMQRITSTGTVTHGAGGLAVCTSAGWQWMSDLFATGSGDATIAWSDERAGLTDAYVQRITAAGSASWTANGALLCGAARGQYAVTAVADNGSGGLLSWTDYRSGDSRYIYAQRVNSGGTGLWTGDGVVPVLISVVRAQAEAGRVRIEWSVASNDWVTVERSRDGVAWTAVARLTPDGVGRIAFEDHDVVAGARYGYRLVILNEAGTQISGEAWIEIPGAAAFGLRAVSPNPSSRSLRIEFSLATAGGARLEVLDLAGRVVAVHELAAFGAGNHVLVLDREVPRAGVYFVRLRQGREERIERVSVLD